MAYVDFNTLTAQELKNLSDRNERDVLRFERTLSFSTNMQEKETIRLHILCNKIWKKIAMIEKARNNLKTKEIN